jgi:hypothetical protein
MVASRLQMSRKGEFCSCKGFATSVEVPMRERWQVADIIQLARGTGRRVCLTSGDRIFVPAAMDEASALLCLRWLDCDCVIVARDCLKCAHSELKSILDKRGSTAAIISVVQKR